MLNSPFSPWPSYSEEEVEAVANVLRSNKVNYWTGNETRQFENEFAAWTGANHAIALANGTLALDVALHALGLESGDEVIVTPRTFIASVSSVVLAGAKPVFADVDPHTQGLSAATIQAVLSPRTKAIVCVHLGGMPCDMDPIMDLARKHGIYVVEDCAQAHGARYKGRHVGTIGDIGAWSFCQDKIMTTGGEGGMVTTNNTQLWERVWSFKDHGKSWAAVYEREHPPGFRWLHEDFGSNYRMLEMQAVIGRLQLQRMEHWTARRTEIANKLRNVFERYKGVHAPRVPANVVHAYYRFYGFVDETALAPGWSRDRIVAEVVARGVPCMQGSCSEVYLEKAFEGTGFRPAKPLPEAKRLGETSIAFLVHPTLTDQEVKKMCDVADEVFSISFAGAAAETSSAV